MGMREHGEKARGGCLVKQSTVCLGTIWKKTLFTFVKSVEKSFGGGPKLAEATKRWSAASRGDKGGSAEEVGNCAAGKAFNVSIARERKPIEGGRMLIGKLTVRPREKLKGSGGRRGGLSSQGRSRISNHLCIQTVREAGKKR